jgi:sugar lactone lactonase YvrE
VLCGLGFPEAPRWRDGRVWFSDLQLRQVLCWRPGSPAPEVVASVTAVPSGLGWDAQGRLLVVSMRNHRLLRLDGSSLVEVADLTSYAGGPCNDMVVDASGRAYVGNAGFDFTRDESPRPTVLVLVSPDGATRVVADDVLCPNGAGFTLDGGTLILAETFRCRLTAFDVSADGSLGDRRIWADLAGERPDGIAVDHDGGCWVATLGSPEVRRVVAGGAVTARVTVSQPAVACALDDAGQWLYVCTAPGRSGDHLDRRAGRIETVRL